MSKDYVISNLAWDALKCFIKRDRDIFDAAFRAGGLRKLCRQHKIRPDAQPADMRLSPLDAG